MVAGTHHIRHAGHDGLHLVKELVPLRWSESDVSIKNYS